MANKTMGNTLKTYMKRHGIKQQFVSDKAGIRPQILGAMLRKKKNRSYRILRNLQSHGSEPGCNSSRSGNLGAGQGSTAGINQHHTHRRRRERKHEVWGRIDPGT